MDKILKIGIIGCGGIANGKHMPALEKVEGVEMVAFCDIVKERAEKTARNISKNVTIKIPAHNIPAFKPSKEFTAKVK